MGKTGAVTTGESPTGDSRSKIIAAPATTLTANTPGLTVTPTGQAPIATPATPVTASTPATTPTGSGTVSVAAPVTKVTATTPAIGLGQVIALAATTLSTTTPAPTVMGVGTAPLVVTSTSLSTTNPTATPTGSGEISIATVATTLTATTVALSGTGAGTAPISTPTTALVATTAAPNIGYENWLVDNQFVGEVTTEVKSVDTLSLITRATTDTVENNLRPLKSDEGQVDVLSSDDGGWTAVDRAGGKNTFTVTVPIRRQDLRQNGEYHVDRYKEDLVSQAVNEWSVELDLIEDANRTDTPSISESADNDEWGLKTRYGEIATGRVDARLLGTGEGGVKRFELTARLTFEQAHVFEAAVSLLNAVRIREIPDNTNLVVDDTDANANTLTIDAPDNQSIVSDGDYVVTDWQSTRLSDAYQSVEITIAKT